MTPDLQQEFQLLSERAKQHLKGVPESGSYRHMFSFWAFPSFSPALRCTLYSPFSFANGKQPFASFTVWRSDLDLEKLRSPVERLKFPKDLDPTIQGDVVWLTDGELEDIQQRIRGISIPLFLGQSQVAGCDGTSFEFRFDEVFFGASIRWWEDRPSEWSSFTKIVTDIATELDERRKKKSQPDGALNGSQPIC